MNFPKDEFWKLSRLKDKNGKYLYEDLRLISLSLEEYPLSGIGAAGGGYVVICDNCGHAKYTYKSDAHFCSKACKARYQYNHQDELKKDVLTRRGRVHRRCALCDKKFSLSISDLRSGMGVFCSRQCAAKGRGFKPLWYICPICGDHFRAVSFRGAQFCSIDCMSQRRTILSERTGEIYTECKPTLLYPDDKYDEIVNFELDNILCKKQINREKNINISMALRAAVIDKLA
mgnify:FL=1